MKNVFLKKSRFLFLSILAILIYFTCSEKKSTNSDDENTLTISPNGGEYTFPDGIILRVPTGAITEETDISLHKIRSTKVSPIFEKRGVSIDNLLACVEGGPDGLTFNLPVQIILSVELEPGEIPIIHEIDLESGEYTLAETEILCDPAADTLVISLSHFSAVSAEIAREYEDLFDECSENPCRCGRIKIEQTDKDFICDNGNCQVTESKVSVTFLDCPESPVEESTYREVSSGCQPELYISAANSVVITGNQTRVSAEIVLGCEPIEGQSVDFSLSNLGLAAVNPTYSTTGSGGTANTIFTAGDEEGIVTVTARSTVSYYTYSISASGGGQQETVNGPLLTGEVSQNMDIKIEKPMESWSGTIIYNFFSYLVFYEYANYEIDYQFFVLPSSPGGSRDIQGTATATQEVTLELTEACWNYQNLNAPSALNLIISGHVTSDSGDIYLTLEKFVEDDPFYEYETCFLCDPENPNDCFETSLIHTLLISNILFEEEKLPLKEGTYTRTYEVLYTTHTYTITLHQDEPPASQVILQKNRGNQKTEIERAEQAKSDFELYLNRRSRD